ncbi:MAG TPA: hypothetical protein VMR65_05735 [Candidatus Sulfotelmatobacter sp.]|jgi:hypothetical protein|nr:hypothetical protein [Candidatus Sulfotelmatobacter sp.]
MKRWIAIVFVLLACAALPAAAQETPPATPPPPPPAPPPAAAPPEAPKQPWTKKLFFGGGLGVTFGNVESVYIAPMIGYRVVPRFGIGLQPFYRYANYDLYGSSTKTHDYGTDVFARVHLFRGLFAEGRYEWMSYEYVSAPNVTARTSDSYWMLGAGYSIGAGPASVYFSALYNFSYDSNDPFRPYDSPWVVQVGASVGF